MEIPSEADVLVIGVGPAGAWAAKRCAELGLKVVAVEKRAEIGSPKRCGEAISKHGMERIGIEPRGPWIIQEISGAIVYSPSGKSIKVDYDGPEGWIVERKLFDKHLASLAAAAGARIFAKTEARGFRRTEGGIVAELIDCCGKKREVAAKIIIAADGVESRVARQFGINTTNKPIDICAGAQYEMGNVKVQPKYIEFFFGNEQTAPGGYTWIFPKGKDTANVGIGIRSPWSKRPAIEYLDEFIAKSPNLKEGSILEVNSGGVPVGGFLEDMVADNLIVVGDASHQVNPIHGGGIPEAAVGGRLAAEVAAEAIREGDLSKKFLKRYDRIWTEERGNKLKKVLKLRMVIESLDDKDLDWLAEYLTGDDLVDFSHSDGLGRLAKILMKKPKLIMLAGKLM